MFLPLTPGNNSIIFSSAEKKSLASRKVGESPLFSKKVSSILLVLYHIGHVLASGMLSLCYAIQCPTMKKSFTYINTLLVLFISSGSVPVVLPGEESMEATAGNKRRKQCLHTLFKAETRCYPTICYDILLNKRGRQTCNRSVWQHKGAEYGCVSCH